MWKNMSMETVKARNRKKANWEKVKIKVNRDQSTSIWMVNKKANQQIDWQTKNNQT